jgi:hypothetical protein
MTKKINQLVNGKTTQLKHEDIPYILEHTPNIGPSNYKKLEKAYRSGKGCRVCLGEEELQGSGFMNVAKKGAKIVKNNKQLNKLKDQAINRAVDYGMEQLGADEQTTNFVKGISRSAVNRGLNEMSRGEGFNLKKGLKMGAKALKIGNKISNAMGYDDLDNMAIDLATNQTLGRIDPTLGRIASNQLQKVADKQIDKYAGSGFKLKKGLKYGAKALKVGNKISNAMGYDDLQDMAIDAVADQTIGRIDPTLGRMAGNALSKVADKQIDKYAGSGVNPYLPQHLKGGSIHSRARVYNDLSNEVHYGSDAYLPSSANLPMFDRLKFQKQQIGAGFRVYT